MVPLVDESAKKPGSCILPGTTYSSMPIQHDDHHSREHKFHKMIEEGKEEEKQRICYIYFEQKEKRWRRRTNGVREV